ncbi:MAG: type II toxin-antitoxin system RelE/ParE family toxin [Pseudomonadota bacterium]
MPASSRAAYRLSPAAQNDLEDIWIYTAQKWSVAQADRYTDILEDTLEQLLFMPKMAHERPEFDPPVRIHPSAEHLIVYRIEEDHLAILRVLGARQDWLTILRVLDN